MKSSVLVLRDLSLQTTIHVKRYSLSLRQIFRILCQKMNCQASLNIIQHFWHFPLRLERTRSLYYFRM